MDLSSRHVSTVLTAEIRRGEPPASLEGLGEFDMTAQTQNGGLARVTSLLAAASWWFQWGTSSAAAKTANAVTTTSTTEARVACSASQVTTTVTNDTLQLTGTITAAGTRAITEVGAFDAAGTGSPPTGGNMDYYCDFTSVGLASGDSIAFTMKVQYS
jgi:hypothetical protein